MVLKGSLSSQRFLGSTSSIITPTDHVSDRGSSVLRPPSSPLLTTSLTVSSVLHPPASPLLTTSLTEVPWFYVLTPTDHVSDGVLGSTASVITPTDHVSDGVLGSTSPVITPTDHVSHRGSSVLRPPSSPLLTTSLTVSSVLHPPASPLLTTSLTEVPWFYVLTPTDHVSDGVLGSTASVITPTDHVSDGVLGSTSSVITPTDHVSHRGSSVLHPPSSPLLTTSLTEVPRFYVLRHHPY
ncbi:hypothetical protein NHX12_012653 [Muraenolepis orangiensis]|uniref:Uncharacterized protein n=1 Tax=Muraenolepis orangiensis TaxID=630683 RepID=A0A9Q0DD23_9TELE|nr:hypothetical protein NHX12_012653 [Muraenolepis orangiensis]